MRELVYEVAQDLQANSIGVFNTADPPERTIFTGTMPDGINEGILMIQAQSPSPERYIDTEYLVIEFYAKSAHSDRALALLRQVYDTYNRRYDWSTTNWHVYFSQALGSIIDMERNAEGSKLFRLSIQFISRNLNTVS
jgi:hypothetical protein